MYLEHSRTFQISRKSKTIINDDVFSFKYYSLITTELFSFENLATFTRSYIISMFPTLTPLKDMQSRTFIWQYVFVFQVCCVCVVQ